VAKIRYTVANNAAPLPTARRSASSIIATAGSAWNQMPSSFFVLRKMKTSVEVAKHHGKIDQLEHEVQRLNRVL
jgi:hypothetical protein